MADSHGDDLVLKRRRAIYRVVRLAKRVGYVALLAAIITFFTALLTGFPRWLVMISIVTLIGACIILPVPIVLGYGIRAAAREDRASKSH